MEKSSLNFEAPKIHFYVTKLDFYQVNIDFAGIAKAQEWSMSVCKEKWLHRKVLEGVSIQQLDSVRVAQKTIQHLQAAEEKNIILIRIDS
mgnify:CR=1 FL=1